MSICKRGHVIEHTPGSDSCKHCKREKYLENREKILAKRKLQYDKNPAAFHAKNAKWVARNRLAVKKIAKRWRERHPDIAAANCRSRQASKIFRTPKWLSAEQKIEIRKKYQESRVLTKITGVRHEVDHVIPLKGEKVSGLHVPWNLQVIPAMVNMSKGNRIQI